MKKGFSVLTPFLMIALLLSCKSPTASDSQLPVSEPPKYLQASSGDIWRRIDFPDSSTGYFWPTPSSTNTFLLKTTDGGLSWRSTKYTGDVQVLRFFDARVGLIVSGVHTVWRTLDGGDTWEIFVSPHTSWGNDIRFDPINVSRVWMTDYQQLFFSNDTGRTWSIQSTPDSGNVKGRNFKFTDSQNGWLLTDGKVYRTLDGNNWSSTAISSFQNQIGYAIDAVDRNVAVISTGMGIFETIDGGTTWQNISNQKDIMSISMKSNLMIWTTSLTKIYHTTNGGSLWVEQYYDTTKTGFLDYIKFFDSLNGIAMGDPVLNSPTLFLYTTDGGITWIQRLPVLKN